jgi:predicted RNA-binding Zn-ribbon protein involved in translation (DUF1610 family)
MSYALGANTMPISGIVGEAFLPGHRRFRKHFSYLRRPKGSELLMASCSSCGKKIAPKVRYVKFPCPKCGETLYRCPRCRQVSNPYSCPKCDFVGP